MPEDTLSDLETTEMDDANMILGERYEIIEELGRGGMGIVYKALDTQLETDVAVKILPPELSSSERAIRNLKQEARTAMDLTHDNIVKLINFEYSKEGAFLLMEYVKGSTLEKLLDDKKKFTVEELIPVFSQICAGLEHAHKKKTLCSVGETC